MQEFPKCLPSICSDNPIIFRKEGDNDVYKDDLILPLCNNIIFYRSKKQINTLNKSVSQAISIKMDIDTLTYKQAHKYLTRIDMDEKYLEELDTNFRLRFRTVDELRTSIFQQLFDE